jgi:hypothetical protein
MNTATAIASIQSSGKQYATVVDGKERNSHFVKWDGWFLVDCRFEDPKKNYLEPFRSLQAAEEYATWFNAGDKK